MRGQIVGAHDAFVPFTRDVIRAFGQTMLPLTVALAPGSQLVPVIHGPSRDAPGPPPGGPPPGGPPDQGRPAGAATKVGLAGVDVADAGRARNVAVAERKAERAESG